MSTTTHQQKERELSEHDRKENYLSREAIIASVLTTVHSERAFQYQGYEKHENIPFHMSSAVCV